MLQRLRAGAAEADHALAALKGVLPPEIATQVWSATIRGATLTAFVSTAAWGTRLRYVAPQITAALGIELGTGIEEIKVKVRARPR